MLIIPGGGDVFSEGGYWNWPRRHAPEELGVPLLVPAPRAMETVVFISAFHPSIVYLRLSYLLIPSMKPILRWPSNNSSSPYQARSQPL